MNDLNLFYVYKFTLSNTLKYTRRCDPLCYGVRDVLLSKPTAPEL